MKECKCLTDVRMVNKVLLRNWIELGIVTAIFIVGAIIKFITNKRVRKSEGFIEINNYGSGRGWKMN